MTKKLLSLPSQSKEYVEHVFAAFDDGVAQDPTSDVVQFSFPALGQTPTVWTAGSWDPDSSTTPPTYLARILVSGTGGGGTVTLPVGTYDMWVKVTDSPEVPARRVRRVVIT